MVISPETTRVLVDAIDRVIAAASSPQIELASVPRYRLTLTDHSDADCVSYEAGITRDDENGTLIKLEDLQGAANGTSF